MNDPVLLNILTAGGFHVGLLIKWFGYSLLIGLFLKDRWPESIVIAFVRTLVGAVSGILLFQTVSQCDHVILYYLVFTAVRAIEWSLVEIFLRKKFALKSRWKFVATAVVVSAMLDVPLAAGWFLVMGGIC